jgi:hypothetical protein
MGSDAERLLGFDVHFAKLAAGVLTLAGVVSDQGWQ